MTRRHSPPGSAALVALLRSCPVAKAHLKDHLGDLVVQCDGKMLRLRRVVLLDGKPVSKESIEAAAKELGVDINADK